VANAKTNSTSNGIGSGRLETAIMFGRLVGERERVTIRERVRVKNVKCRSNRLCTNLSNLAKRQRGTMTRI